MEKIKSLKFMNSEYSGGYCSLTALSHFLTIPLSEEIVFKHFLNIYLRDFLIRKLMEQYLQPNVELVQSWWEYTVTEGCIEWKTTVVYCRPDKI